MPKLSLKVLIDLEHLPHNKKRELGLNNLELTCRDYRRGEQDELTQSGTSKRNGVRTEQEKKKKHWG